MDAQLLKMVMSPMPDREAVAQDVAKRLGITTTTLYMYAHRRIGINHKLYNGGQGSRNGRCFVWKYQDRALAFLQHCIKA